MIDEPNGEAAKRRRNEAAFRAWIEAWLKQRVGELVRAELVRVGGVTNLN